MDSTLNPEQADRQTAVRSCFFTAKTDHQQTWRTLQERNEEMTYWLIQRHFILERGIGAQEVPNTSISTHSVKGTCGDCQEIYEISHTHLPTKLDREQCTHHISPAKMNQVFYSWTPSLTLVTFTFTITSSPTISHWYWYFPFHCFMEHWPKRLQSFSTDTPMG